MAKERNWQTHSMLAHLESLGAKVSTNKISGHVHMINGVSCLARPRKEQLDVVLLRSSFRTTTKAIIFYEKPDVFIIPNDDITIEKMKVFNSIREFVECYKNNFNFLGMAV